jgi:hypothetical protein
VKPAAGGPDRRACVRVSSRQTRRRTCTPRQRCTFPRRSTSSHRRSC